MALTDASIRNAKPGDNPKKLFDERGLFLLVQPSGGKLWRLKYRYLGKEKKLSLGTYPDVSLKVARERLDDARTILANGTDPATVKAALKDEAKEAASNTFASIGEEYVAKMEREKRAAVTIKKTQWLLSLLNRDLGKRPISELASRGLPDQKSDLGGKGRGRCERSGRPQSEIRDRCIATVRVGRWCVRPRRPTIGGEVQAVGGVV